MYRDRMCSTVTIVPAVADARTASTPTRAGDRGHAREDAFEAYTEAVGAAVPPSVVDSPGHQTVGVAVVV